MSDTPLTREEKADRVASIKRDHERKHFVFAMILVMGTMLALPVLGGLYVLLIRWGYFASPIAQ